jgi:hypothetical protein
VDRDVHLGREAGKRFVDRVVHDLVDQVMQPGRPSRADVHRGALPDGVEAFENLDLVGAVVLGIAVAIAVARSRGRLRGRRRLVVLWFQLIH